MDMASTATVIPLRRWRPTIHLGTRLRETRIQWEGSPTQEEFAEILDVPVGTYKGWEAKGRIGDPIGLANRIQEVRPDFDRAWFLGVNDDDWGPDLPGQSSPWMTTGGDFGARRRTPREGVVLKLAAGY